jgi:hypothetical protein
MVGLRWVRLASAGSDDSHEHAALDYPRTVAGQIVADGDPVKRLERPSAGSTSKADSRASGTAGPRNLGRSVLSGSRPTARPAGHLSRDIGISGWVVS